MAEYDHIVPIVGYDLAASTLLYNDLYLPTSLSLALPGDVETRADCQAPTDDDDWSMPDTYCLPRDVEYAFAVTGVVDPRKELLPISLAVDRWGASRSQ